MNHDQTEPAAAPTTEPFTFTGLATPIETAADVCALVNEGRITIDGRPLCPKSARALQVIAGTFAITYTKESIAKAQDAIDTANLLYKLLNP